MVLRNYWILLIWPLTVGLFLNVVIPKTLVTVEGKSEYRWGKFSAFLLVVPYIVGLDLEQTGLVIHLFIECPFMKQRVLYQHYQLMQHHKQKIQDFMF